MRVLLNAAAFLGFFILPLSLFNEGTGQWRSPWRDEGAETVYLCTRSTCGAPEASSQGWGRADGTVLLTFVNIRGKQHGIPAEYHSPNAT